MLEAGTPINHIFWVFVWTRRVCPVIPETEESEGRENVGLPPKPKILALKVRSEQ
jgi:hypothetical protein